MTVPPRRAARWPFVASAGLHVAAFAALVFMVGPAPPMVPQGEPPARVPRENWTTHLVFIPSMEPGGGGGGGNRQTGPIRRAQGRGADRATVRIAPPVSATPAPTAAEMPLPAVVLDARSLAAGEIDQIGLPEGGVSYGTSTGPGSGGGVGSGTGTGIGPGSGPGIGPGRGGGIGGGVYRVGGGVSPPTVVKEVRPSYPPDALNARIQGSVVLELVVTAEGLPADIRIVRSLSSDLDEAAVGAVRQWRFRPGRLGQTPVNVLVTVVLDFSIH